MTENQEGQFDATMLDEVKKHAKDLISQNAKRDSIFKRMENMYWMRWDEERAVQQQIENVKITRSPRARNAIMGAMRLLIASEPVISIPHDINDPAAVDTSDKIERFCKAMWFASGRIGGDPIHYDVVRSGLLYSHINIAINSTKDMLDLSGDNNPGLTDRLEEISQKTPYLFEVLNPLTCYPEYEKYGLSSFCRKVNTTAGYVMDTFGDAGRLALNTKRNNKKINRFDQVTLYDFMDLKRRHVWMDGYDRAILQKEHGLPFLPIVSQVVEGSQMFQSPELNYEPFLYTLDRSGLLDRENLTLTVLYTNIFSLGANPMFVNYLIDPDNPPRADFSIPGGEINLRVGERREPMAKEVIDPSLVQGYQTAIELEAESTIHRQTLGEPIGGSNAPYSSVALLSQSGRLPLTVTQRKAGWAIAEAMEIALKWIRHDKLGKVAAKYEALDQLLNYKDVPKRVDISVQLEIQLPQDNLQAANAANMMSQGEEPLVSHRWARENLLSIGQSADMTREIWDEKTAALMYKKFALQMMSQMAQMEQMALQPGAASGMPNAPQMAAPGMTGQPTPPQPQPLPPGVAQPAEPMMPMPPFMPQQMPQE
jgi:hypothetical protein